MYTYFIYFFLKIHFYNFIINIMIEYHLNFEIFKIKSNKFNFFDLKNTNNCKTVQLQIQY